MLQSYISILRGINVSGHKLIKMSELQHLLEALDFKNIKTYIQSGNVVFQSKMNDPRELERKISEKILTAFGFKVPVLVKDKDEWGNVIKNNPFVGSKYEDITKLHVTFLSAEPLSTDIDKISGGPYGSDEFILSGSVIYLFCPNGYGNTKLSNVFLENKLKVTATTRNWRTINELMGMVEKLSNN